MDAPARNPRVPDFEVETPDIPDPGPALRELLGLGEDEEVSLYTLEDPLDGEKPGWPYPTLIKLAIYGSPNKRLTLQEIYAAVENRFKWFRDSPDKAWQVCPRCMRFNAAVSYSSARRALFATSFR